MIFKVTEGQRLIMVPSDRSRRTSYYYSIA